MTEEQLQHKIRRLKKSLKGLTLANHLNYKINVKFILVTLAVYLVFPFITSENYFMTTTTNLETVSRILTRLKTLSVPINTETFATEERLLEFTINSDKLYKKEDFDLDSLREEELCTINESLDSFEVEAIFDCSPYYRLSNGLNIGTSLFLTVLNIFFPIMLEKDTEKVVLQPLELMMSIVNVLADNPFVEESKLLCFEAISKKIKKTKNKGYRAELKQVQFSLVKIGKLFKVGFGQVGSIVLANQLNTENLTIDCLTDGKKRNAVFSFWTIKNFDSYVSAYEEAVTVLVNKLSELVHSSVFIFDGSTVKNTGEGFFNVWLDNLYCPKTSIDRNMNMADKAVLAAIYFLVQLKDKRTDPRLAKVRLGFGLRRGTGIEGMIGSESKIEPGYLSKDVNLAARLQSATSIYGVDMLIDDTIYDSLNEALQKAFRRIDRVVLKGSAVPVTLYSLNAVELPEEAVDWGESKVLNHYERVKKEHKYAINLTRMGGTDFFLKVKKFDQICLNGFRTSFLGYFEEALEAYIGGDWLTAKMLLRNCLKIKADKPAKVLQKFISIFNAKAPPDWQGYRRLDSK